jgi:pimeloyl-ACP methyl ester carboxylesterase
MAHMGPRSGGSLLAACLCSLFLLAARANGQSWTDPSPHAVRFVEVEPGVRIEVLDWGGDGEALLFLAGHGNTGHVFDDFAPGLTGHGRVLALTRRGFGSSSQPERGYELPTLVRDVVRVMDALGLDRVHLVGHSIAGDEMTWFARTFPNRLRSLIYLDAACDRVESQRVEQTFPIVPASPGPTASELASPAAVRAYVARTVAALPEAEIRATRIFAADQRFEKGVTPGSTLAAVARMVEHPDYTGIVAPILSINAVALTPRDLLIGRYDAGGADARAVFDQIFAIWQPVAAAQRDAFRAAVPHAVVMDVPGANHYVFVSHRSLVIGTIEGFVASSHP